MIDDPAFAAALAEALARLDAPLAELERDDLVGRAGARPGAARRPAVATARQASGAPGESGARLYRRQRAAARLIGRTGRATGLDRFALARNFRALYATSPHRYLLMRRLAQARKMVTDGQPLADVAAATGFADQAHFSRHFKQAFGVTPGRWAGLTAA